MYLFHTIRSEQTQISATTLVSGVESALKLIMYSQKEYDCINTKKPRVHVELRAFVKWRRPTLPRVCSTIGAVGLNFSVRNGKRWNPVAITTGNIS